jgi:hypothetical protein
LVIRSFSQVLFQAIFDFAPGQQNPAFAGGAFQANIRAEAGDFPGRSSTWMGLFKTQNVVQIQFGEHGGIIS